MKRQSEVYIQMFSTGHIDGRLAQNLSVSRPRLEIQVPPTTQQECPNPSHQDGLYLRQVVTSLILKILYPGWLTSLHLACPSPANTSRSNEKKPSQPKALLSQRPGPPPWVLLFCPPLGHRTYSQRLGTFFLYILAQNALRLQLP